MNRVGIGFDVHAFDADRPLVLGGVTIEGAPGLAGWSDADVVVHSLVDALLGAAALGDLGEHFPPESVPEGSSSLDMLSTTSSMLRGSDYRIVNVDVVVVAQQVRVSPHARAMVARLASVLGVEPARVSVKSTTTDRLGAIGRGEGIAAWAVASIEGKPSDPAATQ